MKPNEALMMSYFKFKKQADLMVNMNCAQSVAIFRDLNWPGQ
jgi:hypothetical protein